ncbi:MAG: SPOR domain-containing protein [Spirochaetales bacterium]|nr:SPOR domain-containing protein [Spirochaetales bacterium]
MEENRSFVIILSVTLVVAALFGAAAWLFYPYQQAEVGLPVASRFFREANVTENPEADETNETGKSPVLDGNPSGDQGSLEIVYGILDDATYLDDPLGRQLSPITSEVNTTSSLSLEVQTRTPARELIAQNPTSSTPTSSTPTSSTPTSSTPTSSTPTSSTPTNSTRVQTTAPSQSTQASVTPTTVEEFWIQVLSTPSRDRIEQVQQELESYGLGGRVTTTRIDEVTYYRLRYGPYTQRAEAQKFLDWIKESPRFVDSFISLEYRSSN